MLIAHALLNQGCDAGGASFSKYMDGYADFQKYSKGTARLEISRSTTSSTCSNVLRKVVGTRSTVTKEARDLPVNNRT